jgi:hypothetical protein
LDEFTEEMAVALTDIRSSHTISDMIGFLIEGRVCITTFAPHTTWLFQFVDVILFDILKRDPRYELAFRDEEVTVELRMKVYHGFKQITVDFNICRAFQALLLEFDPGNESDTLSFNTEKSRQSVRTFDWINTPEYMI